MIGNFADILNVNQFPVTVGDKHRAGQTTMQRATLNQDSVGFAEFCAAMATQRLDVLGRFCAEYTENIVDCTVYSVDSFDCTV